MWLVFLFVSIVPKDNIVGTYFLFIFSFIITQSTFSNNIFGTMKGEIVKSFILPVKESEILFHKNMAMGILWIIILLPGFISFSYFRWQEIRFYYLLLAIIFYIFSFFFYITIGNVLSILFPRKSSVDNIQMPLSIESYFVVFFTTPIPFAIFVVLYLIFDYFFKQPIFLFVSVFLWAVISIILYFKLLPIMGKLMENRREELINTLFSKRWI